MNKHTAKHKELMSKLSEALLSEEEAYSLIMMYVTGKGKNGAIEEDIADFISWAKFIRLQAHMINLAIKGQLLIKRSSDGKGYEFIVR